ncbi:MAG: hypothetical protein ABI425_03605 [Patescibacteria group bacterium]
MNLEKPYIIFVNDGETGEATRASVCFPALIFSDPEVLQEYLMNRTTSKTETNQIHAFIVDLESANFSPQAMIFLIKQYARGIPIIKHSGQIEFTEETLALALREATLAAKIIQFPGPDTYHGRNAS